MERQRVKVDENQTGKFNYYSHVVGDNSFQNDSSYNNKNVEDRYQIGDGKYRNRRLGAFQEQEQAKDKVADNIRLQRPTSAQPTVKKNFSSSLLHAYPYNEHADSMNTTNFSSKDYSCNYARKNYNTRDAFANENKKKDKENLEQPSNPYDSTEPFSFEQADALIRKNILTEKKSKNLDSERKQEEDDQSNEYSNTENLEAMATQKSVDNKQLYSPLSWKEQYFQTSRHLSIPTKCTTPNNKIKTSDVLSKSSQKSRSIVEKVYKNATTKLENMVRHPTKQNAPTLKVKYNNETFKSSDQEYKYLSEQEKEATYPDYTTTTQSSAAEETSDSTLLLKKDGIRPKSTSHSEQGRRSLPRPSSRKYGEEKLRNSAECSELQIAEKSRQELKQSNANGKDLQRVSKLTVNSKGKSSSSSLKAVHMDSVLKMFTEIRNYHLQNITDEVVRLRDLEVLPQKLSDMHTSL